MTTIMRAIRATCSCGNWMSNGWTQCAACAAGRTRTNRSTAVAR